MPGKEELKQIALDRNLLLLIEYTYTFSKALLKAQSMVREGEVGKLLGLEMMVKSLGTGCAGFIGSHLVERLLMFPLNLTRSTIRVLL